MTSIQRRRLALATLPLLMALSACNRTADTAAPASSPEKAATAAQATPAGAAPLDEAAQKSLREALAKGLPQLGQTGEIRPTPLPGLYEIQAGKEVFYSDATGRYILQGEIVDLGQRQNLTQNRLQELSRVPFDQLPLKDAVVTVRGKGERKLAVFADPNCRYCHILENNLAKVDNVTIYTFLIPILGDDSVTKSHAIWCSKDASAAWNDWMLKQKTPAAAPAACDTKALDRNLAFAREQGITGTPALFFADGTRVPGAIPTEQIEQRLVAAAAS
ncbi:DsbC family protein [Amphibiibacter pelophylacis]|uniref:DsbC family protein n=1 Tax=Amphibiibacter pelophylacis TaxID=1799477 RepID=A0ACC6P4M6_9BURK